MDKNLISTYRNWMSDTVFCSWEDITNFAQLTIEELEENIDENFATKDVSIATLGYRIRYYTSVAILHTRPIENVERCKGYNLLLSVLVTGDFLLFGDWCLFYGLNEQEFLAKRDGGDKELQLIWTFFHTLYNKLAGLRMIDNGVLKRYESSIGGGSFLPYTERAVIADTVSKNKIFLERGEALAKQLMEEGF